MKSVFSIKITNNEGYIQKNIILAECHLKETVPYTIVLLLSHFYLYDVFCIGSLIKDYNII